MKTSSLFISYSHRDVEWLDRVCIHLKPLERRHGIEVWADTKVRAGTAWADEIRAAINRAKVALVLVSADFLASDFILEQELPALLAAAESHGTIVLPLILSPSQFESSELARFQAVNPPSQALIKLPKAEQEELLVKLAGEIEAALQLESTLPNHLAPQLITELRQNPSQLAFTPERRVVTILHSDISGFTALSENLDPATVAKSIHQYLTAMTDIVFRFTGTLDSYAGYALTAYWGAPVAVADAAEMACRAALEMIQVVRKMNPVIMAQYRMPPLRLSIVITTGAVIVGNLGSQQRFHYSILGESLELLPRLIRVNQQFRCDVLITEFTQAAIGQSFETRLLAEEIQIKGKDKPIAVYELLGSHRTLDA